jgi:hypothetical protein
VHGWHWRQQAPNGGVAEVTAKVADPQTCLVFKRRRPREW